MLHISIAVALVALGSVAATVYKNVETTSIIAGNTTNKYFAIEREPSDYGEILYLEVKRDITREDGIQLCQIWKYDSRGLGGSICGRSPGEGPPLPPHGGIIHGPVCIDLCCALEDLAKRNPDFPRPDTALGLRNRRCPLKKGSYPIPPFSMPETLDVDFKLLSDYTDYSSVLSSKKHCISKKRKYYAYVDLVFVACEGSPKHVSKKN